MFAGDFSHDMKQRNKITFQCFLQTEIIIIIWLIKMTSTS